MTKETKIGLLVGLAFIILFAIILSEKGPTHRGSPTSPVFAIVDSGRTAGPPGSTGQPLKDAGRMAVDSQLAPIVSGATKTLPAAPPRMQEEKIVQAPSQDEPIDQLPDTLAGLLKNQPQHFESVAQKPEPKPSTVAPSSPEPTRANETIMARSAEPAPVISKPVADNDSDAKSEEEKPAEVASADVAKPTSSVTYQIKTEHIVQPGESLGKIAAKYYGRSTPARVDALYRSNRDTLSSIAAVKAGEKLRIPDLGEHNDKFEPVPALTLNELASSVKKDATPSSLLRIPGPVNEAKTPPASDRDSKKTVNTVSAKSEPADKAAFEWYEIRKGDTLSKIARKELGNEKYVREIYKLNKDKLADKHGLKPGTKIRLPSKTALGTETTAALTSRDQTAAEP